MIFLLFFSWTFFDFMHIVCLQAICDFFDDFYGGLGDGVLLIVLNTP